MTLFRKFYIHIFAIVSIIGTVAFIVSGCVSVPDVSHMIVGNEDRVETIRECVPCSQELFKFQSDFEKNQAAVLNADHFELLTWNILKERKDGWEKEFDRLYGGVDLFMIQEACLTDSLKGVFRNEALNWVFAPAFTYRGDYVGVLTASNTFSEPICMERFPEPLIHLPKSLLITRYPLSVPGKTLLVVNVHSINFALGIESFSDHWAKLEDYLSVVDGPVIMAGDFNTWSRKRLAVVQETAHRLSMEPVTFDGGGRSTFFGKVVDHVYYRGLTPIYAEVYQVTTSDHNPMLVSFRLDDNSAIPGTVLD
jgi:endonuclease/exonuclease/phosphatase (EEP) superfamily protein YafD